MKSTAKQEQLHPKYVCGSLPRGVHNKWWRCGAYLAGTLRHLLPEEYGEGQIKNDGETLKVDTFSKLTAL